MVSSGVIMPFKSMYIKYSGYRWKNQDQETKDKVKKLVNEGRFEFTGGGKEFYNILKFNQHE